MDLGIKNLAGWVAVVVVVALCVPLGAYLDRWARAYAGALRRGALPEAATLWGAAARVGGRSCRPIRDGAAALGTGALAAWLLLTQGWAGLGPLVLGLGLLFLALIDGRSGLLPDALTLPLMVLGWGLGAVGPVSAVCASSLIGGGLAVVAAVFRRLRGCDGFGGGDIKCLAMLAGWFGSVAALGILWLASVLGVVWWLCAGRHRPAYPFGPFLALAALPWLLARPGAAWWG